MMAGDSPSAGPVAHTGDTITQDLHFIESSDFRTLAFNALPGESDNNPTIHMEVGDKVIFNVDNAGLSFHSFGVTPDDEGFGGIILGSEVATASNPLKAGESGTSEFVAGEEGIFYYICTVPGHRDQGMVGEIIVGDVTVPEPVVEEMPEPVVEEMPEPVVEEMPEPVVEEMPEPVVEEMPEPVVEEMPEPVVEEMPEPVVEEMPEPVAAYDGPISLPEGSGVPGCDATNECYIPYHVIVSAGEEITWSNDDSAAHTVTSGLPGAVDGIFDSSIFTAGDTFSITLDESGEYPYFCMVHPWMIGNITVN